MGSFYHPAPEESASRWRPMALGLLVIGVAVTLIWFFSRNSAAPANAQPTADPYAAYLKVTDLHLSTAQNFVGGTVTYVGGKVTNTGDKTVVAAQVECTFRNSLGEIVQKEIQPLRVQATPLGSPDFVALSVAPLAPGTTREFRLTFEHISADWNQGFPELRFTKIVTK
jgi:hypothetical protein